MQRHPARQAYIEDSKEVSQKPFLYLIFKAFIHALNQVQGIMSSKTCR